MVDFSSMGLDELRETQSKQELNKKKSCPQWDSNCQIGRQMYIIQYTTDTRLNNTVSVTRGHWIIQSTQKQTKNIV